MYRGECANGECFPAQKCAYKIDEYSVVYFFFCSFVRSFGVRNVYSTANSKCAHHNKRAAKFMLLVFVSPLPSFTAQPTNCSGFKGALHSKWNSVGIVKQTCINITITKSWIFLYHLSRFVKTRNPRTCRGVPLCVVPTSTQRVLTDLLKILEFLWFLSMNT